MPTHTNYVMYKGAHLPLGKLAAGPCLRVFHLLYHTICIQGRMCRALPVLPLVFQPYREGVVKTRTNSNAGRQDWVLVGPPPAFQVSPCLYYCVCIVCVCVVVNDCILCVCECVCVLYVCIVCVRVRARARGLPVEGTVGPWATCNVGPWARSIACVYQTVCVCL